MGPTRSAVAFVLFALPGCNGPPTAVGSTHPEAMQATAPCEPSEAHGPLDRLTISLPDLGPRAPVRTFGTNRDGEVLVVEFGEIQIDLGRWHGVQPGQRFQAYRGDGSRGEGSRLQIVAMMAVTRVEERTSWCKDLGPRRLVDAVHSRIVEVRAANVPVQPGCGLRSPFFEAHEQQVFVLIGARAWGHSRERLAGLIADSGARVREQVAPERPSRITTKSVSEPITKRELLDYLP